MIEWAGIVEANETSSEVIDELLGRVDASIETAESTKRSLRFAVASCIAAVQPVLALLAGGGLRHDAPFAEEAAEAEPTRSVIDRWGRERIGMREKRRASVPKVTTRTSSEASRASQSSRRPSKVRTEIIVCSEEDDAEEVSPEYKQLWTKVAAAKAAELRRQARLAVRAAEDIDERLRFKSLRAQLKGRDYTLDEDGNVILVHVPTDDVLPKAAPSYAIVSNDDASSLAPTKATPLFDDLFSSFTPHEDSSRLSFQHLEVAAGVRADDGISVKLGPSLASDPGHMSRLDYFRVAHGVELASAGVVTVAASPLPAPFSKALPPMSDTMSEVTFETMPGVVDRLAGARVVVGRGVGLAARAAPQPAEDDNLLTDETAAPHAPRGARLTVHRRMRRQHRTLKPSPRHRSMHRSHLIEGDGNETRSSSRLVRAKGSRRLRLLPPLHLPTPPAYARRRASRKGDFYSVS